MAMKLYTSYRVANYAMAVHRILLFFVYLCGSRVAIRISFRSRQFTILQAHIFLNTFDFILLTCKLPVFPPLLVVCKCVSRDFSFSFNLTVANDGNVCKRMARIQRVNFSILDKRSSAAGAGFKRMANATHGFYFITTMNFLILCYRIAQ